MRPTRTETRVSMCKKVWLACVVGVIVSKQFLCSLFVSARCFNLTSGLDSRTAYFIRTFLAHSEPIILFAIAKIVFVGRHRTHNTNGHRTRYPWIFTVVFRRWQTEQFHSGRLLLCATKYRLKCRCYIRWVCVVLPGFDVGQYARHPLFSQTKRLQQL